VQVGELYTGEIMTKVKKALTKAATDNKKKKNQAKTPSLTK
jgi:hypothetical protein